MKTYSIKLDEISQDTLFTGYLWLSDSRKPRVYDHERLDMNLPSLSNPFIAEGNLYDENGKVSYSLKYVDGETTVWKHVLDGDDFNGCVIKEFLSNRMEGRSLCFLDVWERRADELCLGMDVLRPATLVFVGFKQPRQDA